MWLSKDSVTSGRLETEAAKFNLLPTRIPIEQRLYDQLRQWRERLFNDIHTYNPQIPFETVDEVIQKLLNRLIHRPADRLIEDRKVIGTPVASQPATSCRIALCLRPTETTIATCSQCTCWILPLTGYEWTRRLCRMWFSYMKCLGDWPSTTSLRSTPISLAPSTSSTWDTSPRPHVIEPDRLRRYAWI